MGRYWEGLRVRKARSSPGIIFEVTSGKAGKYFKSFSSFLHGEYPAPACTSDLWTLEEECVWKHLEKYVNISLKVFLWNKCHNYFSFCGRTNIYLVGTHLRIYNDVLASAAHIQKLQCSPINRNGSKCKYSLGVCCSRLICVWLLGTPRTAAHQPSLLFTISQSLLKLMSVESVMPSNHLILCRPLFLVPLVFPSTRVFSSESALHIRWPKYWSKV